MGSKRAKESRSLNVKIKKLRKQQAKLELAGCLGDADLRDKEEQLACIHQEILDLNLKREALWTGNQVHLTEDREKKKNQRD